MTKDQLITEIKKIKEEVFVLRMSVNTLTPDDFKKQTAKIIKHCEECLKD